MNISHQETRDKKYIGYTYMYVGSLSFSHNSPKFLKHNQITVIQKIYIIRGLIRVTPEELYKPSKFKVGKKIDFFENPLEGVVLNFGDFILWQI